MQSNWEIKRISDICEYHNNKRVPLKSIDRAKRQGSYPYYGASGIVDSIDDYIFDGTYLLISEDGENLRSRKTPIAFKATGQFWVNNHAHILAEKEEGILDYLEYYFSCLSLTPYLTGAVQPKLSKQSLEAIEIPVPPLEDRLKINEILNSFTHKIANNKAMNQTLEKLAQRIFKSWFIDFDPVKANKEGLPFDGLSSEIQALFPSEFEDSELGMIPKGWSAGKFEDLAVSIATGGTPKRSETSYWNEGIVPWLSSGEVKSGIATSTKECITELGLSKSAAKLWGKNTVVIAMYGATAGEVCLLGLAMTTNQACCGLTPHEHSRSYLFLAARNEKTKLVSKASGAAQQNLNKGLIASHPYVIPSDDILVNFEKVVTPLIEKWMDNEFQNRTLSSLRNRLLPKLISGQISVGEATQELAEAV